MTEDDIKWLFEHDVYEKIKQRNEKQAKCLLNALNELEKEFEVNRFGIGMIDDDFIKDQQTLILKLKNKD